ncbi:cyclase family protein [Pseudofulvibacter geojedonensis]|uniref:Cyclase family protein n=1 Tax=Pseudofulvibacter geojedonensis TaxID=1123758 RepID=A0ABW3I0L9_9FLAO
MIATIQHNNINFQVDLSKPIDISMPLKAAKNNPNAWYLDAPIIEPVVMGDFVGSVSKGASTNFNNIQFNPHAHGTHTECVGHITKEFYSINEQLKTFFFTAEVISIQPEKINDDLVITKKQLQEAIKAHPEAIVIRTLPNLEDKLNKQYSNSNPPYIEEKGAVYLRELGIKHLLIDLPSVDKEKDGGELLSHNAFWNTKGELRLDATITEFIYVPTEVEDGMYLLNLQIAPFHNDASPSKPVLFKIINV